MKSNKLFFGALTLLAFTACSDDKNTNAPDQVLNDGTESYITVRIMDAHSINGRADDYENGKDVEIGNATYEESAIKSLTIAFYDANKNFITYGENASDIDFSANQTPGNNIETIKEVEIKLTLKPDDPTPAYAIAFANPILNNPSLANVTTAQQAPREVWGKEVTVTDKDNVKKTTYLFAMNNTVYFDDDTKEMQVAVPITQANFYKSDISDTEKAKVRAVEFYIERIASKVILHGPDNSASKIPVENITDLKVDNAEGKTLVFVIEKWGLNAVEPKTHLMKCFNQDYDLLTTNLDWGTGVKWNDKINKRSYWAHSMNFNADNFPEVSDDVKDATAGTYPLTYKSYETIMSEGAKIGDCLYTLENTKKKDSFKTNSALISAIIIGHYEIRDNAAQESTPTTFYRRAGAIYTENGFWTAMASVQNFIGKKTSESESSISVEGLSAAELKAIAKVEHPKKNSYGDKIAENMVTIELKSDANIDDYYIKTGEQKYEKYSDVKASWNRDKINSELLSYCGLTEAYTNGKAYFNIPIEHLGRKIDDNPSAGFYGVVRNHTYDIEVSKILNTAFATGVFKENMPIVPTTITDLYNFKANIKVHSWRLVKQSVTLGEK